MVSDADLLEEMDARLAAVADVQFALVQKLSQHIEASEDPAATAALSEPLEQASRSIRLTYALRVKLRKDIRQLDRDEARHRSDAVDARYKARRNQVEAGVQGLLWREFEREDEADSEALYDALDRAINDELDAPAYLTEPLADLVARIIDKLGFTVLDTGDIRPKAPDRPRSYEDEWLSSA